jgi:hypothetical protein
MAIDERVDQFAGMNTRRPRRRDLEANLLERGALGAAARRDDPEVIDLEGARRRARRFRRNRRAIAAGDGAAAGARTTAARSGMRERPENEGEG